MTETDERDDDSARIRWRSEVFPGVEPDETVCTNCYTEPPEWVMAFGDDGDGPRPECSECGIPKEEASELKDVPDSKLKELFEEKS